VNASGRVTDTYHLDAWGSQLTSTGSTPNPYRFGGAWGYITDPSGLLQLGARYYWPEVGRFISQDPIGEGSNWYAYVGNNPVANADPTGEIGWLVLCAASCGCIGGMGVAVVAGCVAGGCSQTDTCYECVVESFSTDPTICKVGPYCLGVCMLCFSKNAAGPEVPGIGGGPPMWPPAKGFGW